MKHTASFFALLIVLFAVMCKNSSPVITEKWSTPASLDVPESVFFDRERQVLYVSCINGAPTEKNGKGYIARLSLKGEILEKKWVTGINAPKGMGQRDDFLYVTDIDRLVQISIPAGKIERTYAAAGARFLNDIAVDASGTVYVSDMVTNRIYALEKGALSVWLELRPYTGVNGLATHLGDLFAGTDQGVLRIRPGVKDVSLFVPHEGGIDGLRPLGDERFIVSDWKGTIEIIAPGRPAVLLLNTSERKINAADIEYIAAEKLLVVPTFFDNRAVAYRLD